MKVKCEYCNIHFDDQYANCPNCGAPSPIVQVAKTQPRTIEELEKWYENRHLPPYEITRFFIDINYTKPRAFGIYKDGNKFVVYKNKADGTRAIRYEGTDEAYAVNELYQKLKDEILHQKSINATKNNDGNRKKNASTTNPKSFYGIAIAIFLSLMCFGQQLMISVVLFMIAAVVISIVYRLMHKDTSSMLADSKVKIFGKQVSTTLLLFVLCFALSFPISAGMKSLTAPHYYNYNDTIYCNYNGGYYEYDYDNSDYYPVSKSELPSDFVEYKSDYLWENDRNWDNGITEFKDSSYYSDNLAPSYSDSSSDSNYDWSSSDSWDSGGTDWGSDW